MNDTEPEVQKLEGALLELPYIPDFLIEDMRFWFAPSRSEAVAVYHELQGPSAKDWAPYYGTKKGDKFLSSDRSGAEGPFAVDKADLDLWILPPGRVFSPKPLFHFQSGDRGIPIVSLPKQRPLNPWKPNYIQALNFIRKYEWPFPLPRSVHYGIWEIEECGQIAGSVSWRNGEHVLLRNHTKEVRETLVDVFYNRPEDYPLGSEVYLRVLGRLGSEGFAAIQELATHPITRKRSIVARTLGDLKDRRGVPTLLHLLEDEDPDVRTAALRAMGKVGITPEEDPEDKVRAYLDSDEVPKRVWAAQALVKGGEDSHEKFLVGLVKDEPRLLTDMGEMGDVLSDLELYDAVPFCINRLKHEKSEFRADAAEALGKITGVELEYHSVDSDEERRNAIKTYSRWWEERKRERRKKRR